VRRSIRVSAVQSSTPRMSCAARGDSIVTSSAPKIALHRAKAAEVATVHVSCLRAYPIKSRRSRLNNGCLMAASGLFRRSARAPHFGSDRSITDMLGTCLKRRS
jgi:hypothetical protein